MTERYEQYKYLGSVHSSASTNLKYVRTCNQNRFHKIKRMVNISIRTLKSGIDSLWAEHKAFRVMIVVVFLGFITIMAFLIALILHEYNPLLLAIFVWLILIGLIIMRRRRSGPDFTPKMT